MQKSKLILLFTIIAFTSFSQKPVIDKIIGVVGKYPILLSDLQNAMVEREKQDGKIDKCKAFEMLVFQKLLIAQADRDSVTVTDNEVDHELTQRMMYYIQQFGSEEKLEEFYGKRTNVIKDELRGDVQEQLIAQKMQGKITGEVKLTPAEVRQFYNSIPQDSLPLINSEVELQQIVKKPTFSAAAKLAAKEQLQALRDRVAKGEKMKTLAKLYTEDPGSQPTGGEYDNVGRGVMDPSFEAVMFRLKQGEVSEVFESAHGYHFIELIQRKGEMLDIRHILIIPKMSNADFYNSKLFLDTVYSKIKNGEVTFEEAARKYSDDNDTKQNGGLMINRNTASTKFDDDDLNQIDPDGLIATLNAMQIGDISKPMKYQSPTDGKPGFRLLKLKNRIDPHKTNMKDDYQKLAALANADYNKKQVKEWIRKRSKITYIKLDPEYTCTFENNWTISN